MYLTQFAAIFREQGLKETRVMTIHGHPSLPEDEYALFEAYCTDPECDCRRVMLNVVGKNQGGGLLASIGFGFDRDAAMAGPYLDPLNRQSRYAEALFELVKQVLADPAYVARLERHYEQFKRAAADPEAPGYEAMQRIRTDEKRTEASTDRKAIGARKRGSGTRKKKRRKR